MFHRAKRVIGIWIPVGQIRDCHPRELETELGEGKLEGKEAEERNEEEGKPNRKEKCSWKESLCPCHLISRKTQKSLRGKISSLLSKRKSIITPHSWNLCWNILIPTYVIPKDQESQQYTCAPCPVTAHRTKKLITMLRQSAWLLLHALCTTVTVGQLKVLAWCQELHATHSWKRSLLWRTWCPNPQIKHPWQRLGESDQLK